MPDGDQQTEPPADDETTVWSSDDRIFTAYGIASAVLGVLSVAAVVLGVLTWSAHRGDVDERSYQSRVLQKAAEWTGDLINMNTDNVDASLQRLHDGTVGELNVDFDSALKPYREVMQRLKSHSTGRVEAVAIESVHHDLDAQPGAPRPQPSPPPPGSSRTDTVMVVATSVAENVGGKPQILHWKLRLDVADLDDKLLVSRLEWIR